MNKDERIAELEEEVRSLKKLLAYDGAFSLPECTEHFTNCETAVLAALHLRPGKIMAFEFIWNSVYMAHPKSDSYEPNTLKVWISKIRGKLVGSPWSIRTHWGIGYSLHHSAAADNSKVGTLGSPAFAARS